MCNTERIEYCQLIGHLCQVEYLPFEVWTYNFRKLFLIACTGFRLRQRQQPAVLHLNLWKLPHRRYSPAKQHVSEVHLIGYASYFNNKSNLSSELITRSKNSHLNKTFFEELFRYTTTRRQLLTSLTFGCDLISPKATK